MKSRPFFSRRYERHGRCSPRYEWQVVIRRASSFAVATENRPLFARRYEKYGRFEVEKCGMYIFLK